MRITIFETGRKFNPFIDNRVYAGLSGVVTWVGRGKISSNEKHTN
jgi:hypothetical protein